ncbi:uncharacterized protein LOC129618612 [Condylostylus longicornis]|uniref:uncharacterized protein LOC129618612 n=1 Tax=Condylostylus longicornis TaxID=2530218 RepID=UPI00244DD109|nr:uncharacterized protein LOC129618612 [Condylostylus longicornis]XP_055389436.1 uncharacterized protein LOC129618612 [Condylostylus longicornis]
MFFKIIFFVVAAAYEINCGVLYNLQALERFQDSNLTDDQKQNIIMTNTNWWSYIPNTRNNQFDFWVKAGSNAHVSISNAPQFAIPRIAFTIGGWENTQSAFYINNTFETSISSPDILDKNEYRGFWVKWTQDGYFSVGKRLEDTPFLTYKHTERLFPINFIGVGSNTNKTAYWIINDEFDVKTENYLSNIILNNQKSLEKIQETDLTDFPKQTQTYEVMTNSAQFRYVPAVHRNHLDFSVKAESDAQISLSNNARFIDPKIVIVIGGWENSASVIRINDVNVTKSNTPDLLNDTEYRGFWIKWFQDGNILVGKKNEFLPFLVYKYTEQFFPINFIGVSSLDNRTTAHWIINEDTELFSKPRCLDNVQKTDLKDFQEQRQSYEIITNTPPFRYVPAMRQHRLDFRVKAESDAHISLSNAAELLDQWKMIIIIGGLNNTASSIRIHNVNVTNNNTPNILSKNEYRDFWIEWTQGGDISVGKKEEFIPFLLYKYVGQFYPVNFIGFSCESNNITGHWIIY